MHYTYVLVSERDKRMARYNSEQQVGTALELCGAHLPTGS